MAAYFVETIFSNNYLQSGKVKNSRWHLVLMDYTYEGSKTYVGLIEIDKFVKVNIYIN